MLARILGLLGLHALVLRVRQATRDAEEQAINIGVMAGFWLAGAVMALVTFIALLVAVFCAVDHWAGLAVALAVVVAIPALFTVVLAGLAYSRKSRLSSARRPAPGMETEVAAEPEIAGAVAAEVPLAMPQSFADATSFSGVNAPFELRNLLSDALGGVFRSVPSQTGTPIDGVIHRFTREAAGSSTQTVDIAAELVSRGSRSTLVGILASTMLLGWYLARHPAERRPEARLG